MKASVERVEDAPIRKLAQPERADRLQRQKARLVGLRIEGRLEPSDRLVCGCGSLKEDRHMTIDHHGVVRLKDKEMKDDVNISTDMFLRLALMRRGLANILDYLIHDRWVERIFDVRSAEQPEGYAQVSQQQVISADNKLAEFTRSGIQLQPSGRPADTAFVRAMEHPDVTHLLQPLPRISATSPPKRPLELAHTDRHVSPKTKGRSKQKSQQGSRAIRMPAVETQCVSTITSTAATFRSPRADAPEAFVLVAIVGVTRWITHTRIALRAGQPPPDKVQKQFHLVRVYLMDLPLCNAGQEAYDLAAASAVAKCKDCRTNLTAAFVY